MAIEPALDRYSNIPTSLEFPLPELYNNERNKELEASLKLPHIFISNSHVPAQPTTVRYLFHLLRPHGPSKIDQDDFGYYLFFFTGPDNRTDMQKMQKCYDNCNRKTWRKYVVEMQVFPNGQRRVLKDTADLPVDDSDLGVEDVESGAKEVETEARARAVATPSSPARVVATPSSPCMSTSGHIVSSKSNKALSEHSSVTSSMMARKCHICKKSSPLDATSLVTCTTCQKRYHKGCHRPAIPAHDLDWNCIRCSGKRNTEPLIQIKPAIVADSISHPEALQPPAKKRKRNPSFSHDRPRHGAQQDLNPLNAITEEDTLEHSRPRQQSITRPAASVQPVDERLPPLPPETIYWGLATAFIKSSRDRWVSLSDIKACIEASTTKSSIDLGSKGKKWQEDILNAESDRTSDCPEPILESRVVDGSNDCEWRWRVRPAWNRVIDAPVANGHMTGVPQAERPTATSDTAMADATDPLPSKEVREEVQDDDDTDDEEEDASYSSSSPEAPSHSAKPTVIEIMKGMRDPESPYYALAQTAQTPTQRPKYLGAEEEAMSTPPNQPRLTRKQKFGKPLRRRPMPMPKLDMQEIEARAAVLWAEEERTGKPRIFESLEEAFGLPEFVEPVFPC